VLKGSQRDILYGMATTPRREHIDFDFRRQTNARNAPAVSDLVKRYRRCFQTHDLRGCHIGRFKRPDSVLPAIDTAKPDRQN
jgi:hypothetical protein